MSIMYQPYQLGGIDCLPCDVLPGCAPRGISWPTRGTMDQSRWSRGLLSLSVFVSGYVSVSLCVCVCLWSGRDLVWVIPWWSDKTD